MKPTKKQPEKTTLETPQKDFLFTRENYIIMIAGLLLIVIGYFLMVGGGSEDPAVFNEDIFDTQRITISPLLLFIGYGLQIVAIFYKKKVKEPQQ